MKILSGGQTGADRAALDAAIKLGIPYGGWLPKGRKTEDGPLPAHYNLKEMPGKGYRERTEKNVLEAEATLICSFGELTGGSALTQAFAVKHNRPCLHLDFAHYSQEKAVHTLKTWIRELGPIRILNVAGPRASGDPRIYKAVYELLIASLSSCPPLNRG